MSKTITLTVSLAVLATALDNSDLSEFEIAVLKSALENGNAGSETAAVAVTKVSADKLAEFLDSDSRFQRARSVNAAASYFAVSTADILATVQAHSDRFTTRNSTRGLGTLITER